MAILLNPLSSEDARNKFGPVLVFSGWRAIKVARTRVVPTNPRSSRQLEVRGTLTGLAQGWGALTAANALAWRAYAAAHPKSNAFGQFAPSGINAYCELNFYVVDSGETAIATPPVTAFTGNISGFTVVTGTVAAGDLKLDWSLPAGADLADWIDIWVSRLLPNGNISAQESDFRHTIYTPGDQTTKTIEDLVPDGWYAARARFLMADGRAGLFFEGMAQAKGA